MLENKTENPLKKPIPWKWVIIVTVIVLAVKWMGGSKSEDKGNCNCEYKDELGNRKRVHAIDKQSCESYPGKWLGYDVTCEVTKYNAPW